MADLVEVPGMPRATSTLRAVVAMALMVGFYVMVIGIVAGLFHFSVLTLVKGRGVRLPFVGIVFGLVLLISIVPRRAPFVAPGPRLRLEAHPQLASLFQRVAKEADETIPAEVYLTADVNAAVFQYRGRRIAVLGLPLLAVLTTEQSAAVLGHELGHFRGGDTRWAPAIARTRWSILRSLYGLESMSSATASMSVSAGAVLLRLPFQAYAALYLRLTAAISRRQELDADQLAARVASPAAIADALRTIQVVGVAWKTYLTDEVGPVLAAGLRPPVAEGFLAYLRSPLTQARLDRALDRDRKHHGASRPHDSHPPLLERIAALGSPPPGPLVATGPHGASLIEELEDLEAALLQGALGVEDARRLPRVAWDRIGAAAVSRSAWFLVKSHRPALERYSAESILEAYRTDFTALARDLRTEVMRREHPRVLARAVTTAALEAVLLRSGFRAVKVPGERLRFERGPEVFEPGSIDDRAGVPPGASWDEILARTGLGGECVGVVPTPSVRGT